jgi:membrane-bound serine protease (ClpP class)
MCHVFLVLPFIAPVLFLILPFDQALQLYSLILAVSVVVYWLVWKDMRTPVATGIEGMIGGVGEVIGNGTGTAKVFYKGEIWDAICREEVFAGDSVRITGLERMKLIVSKVSGTWQQSTACSRC